MKVSLRNEHVSFSRHVVTDGSFSLTVEINKFKNKNSGPDYTIFSEHINNIEKRTQLSYNLLREFPIYIKLLADIDLILRRELKFRTKGFSESVIDYLTEPPEENNQVSNRKFKEKKCDNCGKLYIPTSSRSLYCDICKIKKRG